MKKRTVFEKYRLRSERNFILYAIGSLVIFIALATVGVLTYIPTTPWLILFLLLLFCIIKTAQQINNYQKIPPV